MSFTRRSGSSAALRALFQLCASVVLACLALPQVHADPSIFTPKFAVPLSTQITSDPTTVTNVGTNSPISVIGGEYSVDGSAFTSAPGTVTNGQSVRVRLVSSGTYQTFSSAVVTIGQSSATFTVVTQPDPVQGGNILYFVSQQGDYVGGGQNQAFSNANGTAFGVTHDTNHINFSAIRNNYQNWWYLNFAAPSGSTLAAGVYSGATRFATTTNPGLDVSGDGRGCSTQAGSFEVMEVTYAPGGEVTTFVAEFEQHCEGSPSALFGQIRYSAGAIDTVPDSFYFNGQSGVEPNTTATSNSITVAGINAPAAVSVTGGMYSINGAAFTAAAGTVNNGDTVAVRMVSASTYNTTTTATLTISGIEGTFSVSTVQIIDTQAPTVPASLSATAVSTSQINLSWNASTDNVGVSHYRVSRNGVFLTYVYPPNVSYSDSGLTASTLYSYTVAACDAAGYCSADSTLASATTFSLPAPFSFTAQSNVARNTVVTSNAITISGLNAPASISVTGGEYSINGGAYTSAAGTVVNGQTVTVRLTTSSLYNTTTIATLTIGGMSATFAVTTVGQPIAAASYWPLATGTSWTMRLNGVGGYTGTITGTQQFNGAMTSVITYAYDGSSEYLTNDSSGLRLHGAYYPPEFVDGCGLVPLTLTNSPPIPLLPASGSVGQTVNSSGVITIELPGCDRADLAYSTSATAAAVEVVTVPAGAFEAVRIYLNLSLPEIGGYSSTSYWLARDIGMVRQLASDGTLWELESTSIARTAPDAFEFPPQTGVQPATAITSNTITIRGTTAPAPISITGGQYSINGGAFTSAAGTVTNGQTVTVRQTSSASPSTTTNTTLTVGGVSATFSVTTVSLPSHLLTVQKSGTGTVTSNPAGINCGATCSASYLQGTSVTLTAVPSAGTPVFGGWSGGGCSGTGTCTVPMSGPTTVTATFIADTQAPSVPAGLTATAVSGSQINLAWNASSDNVGVTAYRVFRDGVFRTTVSAPALVFGDTGLAATALYSYTVAACDAAGNCSAPSSAVSATTLAAGQVYFEPKPEPGFNLFGNVLNVTLDVAALFGNQDPGMQVAGVTAYVESVWKWNSVQDRWAFYSPLLTSTGIAAYAAGGGYEVLATIDPGEGYWVKATQPLALPAQSGTGFTWNGFNFAGLPSGFNLISDPGGVTPSEFNRQVTEPPPGTGVIPTTNFRSLWAWDAVQMKWYFYATILEASGGLDAVRTYTDTHNLLHFQDYNRTLGVGMGFWVNRP